MLILELGRCDFLPINDDVYILNSILRIYYIGINILRNIVHVCLLSVVGDTVCMFDKKCSN